MYTAIRYDNYKRALALDLQKAHTIEHGMKWYDFWLKVEEIYKIKGYDGLSMVADPEGYGIRNRITDYEEEAHEPAIKYILKNVDLYAEFLYSALLELNALAKKRENITGGEFFEPASPAFLMQKKELLRDFMSALDRYSEKLVPDILIA